MSTRGEIRKVIDAHTDDNCLYSDRDCEFCKGGYCVSDEDAYRCLMKRLDELGVVMKVDRELPYKWGEITRKHSYRPSKEFTTYTLKSKYDTMFGYIQKYQSLTGYECFEKPIRFCIYLGNEERAHSDRSFPTLRRAKENLLEQFLSSKDNPDNEIPAGYVVTESLRKEVKVND